MSLRQAPLSPDVRDQLIVQNPGGGRGRGANSRGLAADLEESPVLGLVAWGSLLTTERGPGPPGVLSRVLQESHKGRCHTLSSETGLLEYLGEISPNLRL